VIDKIRDDGTDLLFSAILTLETLDECYRFFDDLCTVPELRAMAQRIVVAKMLRENKHYSEIAESTKVSTATISRVKRSLHYGRDGYDIVFKRLEKQQK